MKKQTIQKNSGTDSKYKNPEAKAFEAGWVRSTVAGEIHNNK